MPGGPSCSRHGFPAACLKKRIRPSNPITSPVKTACAPAAAERERAAAALPPRRAATPPAARAPLPARLCCPQGLRGPPVGAAWPPQPGAAARLRRSGNPSFSSFLYFAAEPREETAAVAGVGTTTGADVGCAGLEHWWVWEQEGERCGNWPARGRPVLGMQVPAATRLALPACVCLPAPGGILTRQRKENAKKHEVSQINLVSCH